MATTMVTDSMRAYAQVLLSKSSKWARGIDHERGVAFVMFTSSRVDKDGKPIYHRRAVMAMGVPVRLLLPRSGRPR